MQGGREGGREGGRAGGREDRKTGRQEDKRENNRQNTEGKSRKEGGREGGRESTYLLDAEEVESILIRDEVNGQPQVAKTTRATNAVEVCLRGLREGGREGREGGREGSEKRLLGGGGGS